MSLPIVGAPGGGRDARSGRRGSHRLRDGKAYPRSKKFLGRNIGAVDTRPWGGCSQPPPPHVNCITQVSVCVIP